MLKLRVEITDTEDEEVIIRCRKLTDEVLKISEAVSKAANEKMTLALTSGGEEHFIPCEEILFFETNGKYTAAHTSAAMYYTQYKLYELEKLLPAGFTRASKSCIVNTAQISSISHSPVSSSETKFKSSHKRIYISRAYYKTVREIIEEMRIRK